MLRRKWLETIGIFALGLLICLLPGHFSSASLERGGSGLQTEFHYLDLPNGFSISQEEEDEPEIIEFYNELYEGDAFVFVLDRSSSMGQASQSGRQKFDVLKSETVRALSSMSERSVASVVFYDGSPRPLVYGDPPLKMNPANKARLISQVLSTPLGRGSCILRGVLKGLDILKKAKQDHKVLILTSDGRTTCPNGETDPERIFRAIMAHNVLKIPINTIYTGPRSGQDWQVGKPLLERIARATGGKFKIAY